MGIKFFNFIKNIFKKGKHAETQNKINLIQQIKKIEKKLLLKANLEDGLEYYSWNSKELMEWYNIISEIDRLFNEIDNYHEDYELVEFPFLNVYLNRAYFISALKNKFLRSKTSQDKDEILQRFQFFAKNMHKHIEDFKEEVKKFRKYIVLKLDYLKLLLNFISNHKYRYDNVNIENVNEDSIDKILKDLIDKDIKRLDELAFFYLALKRGSKITLYSKIEKIKENLQRAKDKIEEISI